MTGSTATVRLLLVDEGVYHHEDIQIPAEAVERYDRLIDLLREEPEVLRHTYLDLGRLCTAYVVKD